MSFKLDISNRKCSEKPTRTACKVLFHTYFGVIITGICSIINGFINRQENNTCFIGCIRNTFPCFDQFSSLTNFK